MRGSGRQPNEACLYLKVRPVLLADSVPAENATELQEKRSGDKKGATMPTATGTTTRNERLPQEKREQRKDDFHVREHVPSWEGEP